MKFELSLYNKIDGKMVSAYGLKNLNEGEFRRRINSLVKRHDLSLSYKSEDKLVYKKTTMSLVGTIYD